MKARSMAAWLKKDLPALGLIAVMLVSLTTAAPTRDAAAQPASGAPGIFGCPMYPTNNIWNTPVDSLPVDSHSSAWVSSVGSGKGLHMDFGSGTWDGGPIGIPLNSADSATPKYAVDFYYGDESDPGPYPIPSNPLIEYGSDHHMLVVDQSTCKLYELYDVSHNADGSWSGGSGAIWDLNSNALRPADWTSADAAGLPILPGLVRYEEMEGGEINHAIRFTTHATNGYIWPARHLTSGSPGVLTSIPPMGARFRLKASFDVSGYPAQMQVILRAMQKYGIILADNGSDWFITGAPDSHWDNDMLHLLDDVTGNNFEAVDESGLMVSADSGATSLSVTISGNAGVGGATLTYAGGTSTPAADEPALEASTPDAALTYAGNSATIPEASLPVIDPAKLAFQQVASGLTSPVFVTNAGDGSGRLFILEQPGRIRIVKNGSLLATPFLNISSKVLSAGSEQGLLGLAFHPSYTTNGYFYVAYTAPGTGAGSLLTLERYSVSGNPDVANTTGSVVLTIDHPTNSNHNGGMLAFGPDGFLYWSTGDGGSGGDPPNNAQTLTVLLGKILRLDVDSASPYAVPSSNPFVSNPNANALIWAYGLRNSWRYSFDRLTGDLYIGDVGQNLWEEVDFQPAGDPGGKNYGWRMYEGTSCYSGPCTSAGKQFPVTTYDHSGGRCAVTGGYVYRGSNFPSLAGRYFYGDYCSGQLWSLYNNGGWIVEQLVDTSYSISSFGQDESGDLYLVDLGGSIYRIVYNAPAVTISGNAGVGSATLTYTGGSTTADGTGHYTITVPYNWLGKVTPSKAGYTFTPDHKDYPNLTANQSNQDYAAVAANANVDVTIAGSLKGSYAIPSKTTLTTQYPGVQNGPVEVFSSIPVVPSQRVDNDQGFTNELMGYPDNQLTTHYWFPWYDNLTMISFVLIGNPSTTTTAHATIKIAGSVAGTWDIPPSGRVTPWFPGVQNGPVEVTSDIPVFTSERVHTGVIGSDLFANELMGYPNNQLTTHYWFPWYDNLTMISFVLIGNPSSTLTAHATIKIAGSVVGTWDIPPSGRVTPWFPGVQDGPVEVTSNIPVFASERVHTGVIGSDTFTNELMGYPDNHLTTDYWFPWYDNLTMISFVLIGNPSTTTTAHATIKIAGSVAGTWDIPPSGRVTPWFPGVQNGPVEVTSDIPVFTSERVHAGTIGSDTFVNEMMGYPASQLTTHYWFTWYDNLDMISKVLIGIP